MIDAGNGGDSGQNPFETPERQVERDIMVDYQIVARGVKDHRVIQAMRQVPRHRFVDPAHAEEAYEDHPIPIGYGQTISQPYIVAFMTEALRLRGHEKVLEIGTGSGYQAAVLGLLARQVFSIEIVKPLAEQAARVLRELGYVNVVVRAGNGYAGWPEESPFDAIILTAAPEHIPQTLVEQLTVGGRMILPVGKFQQELLLIRRTQSGFEQSTLLPVAFVPMTGEAEGASGEEAS